MNYIVHTVVLPGGVTLFECIGKYKKVKNVVDSKLFHDILYLLCHLAVCISGITSYTLYSCEWRFEIR